MKRGLLYLIIFLSSLYYISAFCGDGIIDDEKETCVSCPEDNPCFVGETCIYGECVTNIFPSLFIKDDPEATVIIPKIIAERMNSLYTNSTHEFVACLKGKYSPSVYQITKMIIPEIKEQGEANIIHAACPRVGTIGTIHSHPGGDCELSKRDAFAFGARQEPTNAIICGPNNFAFYSKENLDTRMNFLIREIPEEREPKTPWLLITIVVLIILIIITIIALIIIKLIK